MNFITQNLTKSLLVISVVTLFIFAAGNTANAASAVAFDGTNAVYGYSFNWSNVSDARTAALNSCSRRGGRNCRIVTSCSTGGYGIIYLRRRAGRKIEALGASCGAGTWARANDGAKRSCNAQNRGRCGGPKASWFDKVQSQNTRRTTTRRTTTRRTAPVHNIRWDTTLVNTLMFRNSTTPGQRFTMSCPPRGYLMNVYGSGTYHIKSSVCTAAVHRGLINTNGGTVRIRIIAGPSTFAGSTRNGVRSYTSRPLPAWRLGFAFV